MEELKKYKIVKPIVHSAVDGDTIKLDPNAEATKKWLRIGCIVLPGKRPAEVEKKDTHIPIGGRRTIKQRK